MPVLAEWFRRLAYLLQQSRRERELRQEMEAHRDLLHDPRTFGNTLKLREDAREVWGWGWLDDLTRDARFAWRMLVRNPGFALVSIVSLALATGATTAIFGIVNGVLLRPLPLHEPDRLLRVFGRNFREDRGAPDPMTAGVASQELNGFASQSASFEGFTGYEVNTRHLDGPTGPERLMAVIADREFFSVLRAAPLLGRTFTSDDRLDVAVISARLWQRRFNADPSLPGKKIVLDGQPCTVLGVMPEMFQFPYGAASLLPSALPESRTDIWVPVERRGRLNVVGRLKPGVSVEKASAELQVIAARLEQQHYAGTRIRIGVRLERLADVVVRPVRRSLWVLFAAVALVLIAACANVANLLLARMTVRIREVVTRAALGADRVRLLRQFLAESVLLSLAGGLLGVAVARWGSDLLVTVGAARIPRAHEISLDWHAFGFLLLACIVSTILFGLLPALTASRVDVQSAAKDAAGHATGGRKYGRIRDGLIVLEVALAFVLAVATTILMAEVIRLQRMPSGMTVENVLTLHITPRATAQEYYAIEERVLRVAGVHAAGLTQLLPLQHWGWIGGFDIPGQPSHAQRSAQLRYVTPGYFRALGIPVVRGREFGYGDVIGAPAVVLINETLARQYFAGEDPVGRVLDRGTIAGVVGGVRQVRLDRPVEPEIYYPIAQNVASVSDIGMSLVARTALPPEGTTEAIRAAVRAVNPRLAIFNVKTMEQVVTDSMWELNLYRWLIGLFAGLVLIIAAIGLYGVISYNVTSRLRECAIRLALGSDPDALTRLVLKRALMLCGLGVTGGMLMAVCASFVISSLVPSARVAALAYVASGAVLLGISLLASAAPAMRIARVNPASALRHD